MTTNLHQASNQWSTRPADERYESLEAMLAAARRHKHSAKEKIVQVGDLQAVPTAGGDLTLVGKAGNPARLTNWSFGQLAQYAGAPPSYLRELPAALAAVNINHGLAKRGDDKANLLLHSNGSLIARSLATDSYGRIWDADLIERLIPLQGHGWRVPPARPALPNQPGTRPATEADVLRVRGGNGGLSVNVGDLIAPAGLYASDHDCFVFMVNEDRRIDDGSDGGLSRGFFLSNSEVANGRALKLTAFLYRHVCGNHIVWGASSVVEVKVHHKGEDALGRFSRQMPELRAYADRAASEDEARIAAARRLVIGNSKEELEEVLYTRLRGQLSRALILAAFERAKMDSNFDKTINPFSCWGWVQGATAHSQSLPFADERNRIDRAAEKVLQLAI